MAKKAKANANAKVNTEAPPSLGVSDGMILTRDDLDIVYRALPRFAMDARLEAAQAEIQLIRDKKANELSKTDSLRRRADEAMALHEKIDHFIHYEAKAKDAV